MHSYVQRIIIRIRDIHGEPFHKQVLIPVLDGMNFTNILETYLAEMSSIYFVEQITLDGQDCSISQRGFANWMEVNQAELIAKANLIFYEHNWTRRPKQKPHRVGFLRKRFWRKRP